MELDFTKIERIERIRIKKKELLEMENSLSKPLIHDFTLIPIIYKYFVEEIQKDDFAPNEKSVIQRKKFIFIILYLFSPSTLSGGKMRMRLRNAIAEAVQVKSLSIISDNCNDVAFLYKHYKGFCDEVKQLFYAIGDKLKNEGLIK